MIPFSPPRIDQKIIDEVTETLKSGWITTGPRTKQFEKEIANYIGVPKVMATNSATAGLELVLRWFGVGDGDEVIVPVYTYAATGNVVLHCGATVVFCEVSSDFNMDVNKLESLITDKTKVIMPVDFSGYPCDYDEMMTLIKSPAISAKFKAETDEQRMLGRILLLSDSAHSLGGQYKGKQCGALADFSVFSFHAVKNLITAEGGAICFNLPEPFSNEELYKYFCIYGLHGQTKDALAKSKKGAWEYDIIVAGYKTNMPDIAAAIGLIELGRYEEDTLPRRKHICERYRQGFSKFDWAELPNEDSEDKRSSYHLFPLRIKNVSREDRNEIIQKIFDQEVSVNVHFKPLPMLSIYTEKGYSVNDFPVALDLFDREISLPVYYDLTDELVDKVIQAVSSAVSEL